MDSKLKAFLETLAAQPRPEPSDLPLEEALRTFRAGGFVNPSPRNSRVRVTDSVLAHATGRTRVRWYVPKASAALPTVINLHGGGWVGGSLEMDDFRCHKLAQGVPCAVASVDYSLAPEHRYPVALRECAAVLDWLSSSNRPEWVNPSCLGILGSSAGGALALAVCLRARDFGLPVPAFLMLLYPAVDDNPDRPSYKRYATGYSLTAGQMRWFIEQYRDPAAASDPYCLPLKAGSFAGLPSTLLIGAQWDVLADEVGELAARMRDDGTRIMYSVYGSTIHGFVSAVPDSLESRLTLNQCIDFAREICRGEFGT